MFVFGGISEEIGTEHLVLCFNGFISSQVIQYAWVNVPHQKFHLISFLFPTNSWHGAKVKYESEDDINKSSYISVVTFNV